MVHCEYIHFSGLLVLWYWDSQRRLRDNKSEEHHVWKDAFYWVRIRMYHVGWLEGLLLYAWNMQKELWDGPWKPSNIITKMWTQFILCNWSWCGAKNLNDPRWPSPHGIHTLAIPSHPESCWLACPLEYRSEVRMCDFWGQVIKVTKVHTLLFLLDNPVEKASCHVTKTLKQPCGESRVVRTETPWPQPPQTR